MVRFQSFGQTHDESFYVQKAAGTDDPIGWGMIHGAATTYTGRNPCFHLIYWDEGYMIPVSIEAHCMDISEANSQPNEKPVWSRHHEFKEAYGLYSLSPAHM